MTTTSTYPVTLSDFVRILNVVAAVMQGTALQQSQTLFTAAQQQQQQQPYAIAMPTSGAAVAGAGGGAAAAAASSALVAALGGNAATTGTTPSAAGSGLKLVAAAGYPAGSLYQFAGAHAYSVGSAALELCDLGTL
jgi:hypothetical protein